MKLYKKNPALCSYTLLAMHEVLLVATVPQARVYRFYGTPFDDPGREVEPEHKDGRLARLPGSRLQFESSKENQSTR